MKTFEEWVNICNNIHKNKYKYIKKYKKDNKYWFLEIVCDKHGIFNKKIQNHTKKKQGCPKCSKPSKLTREDFIKKANTIHKNKYDYSLVEYKNTNEKIQIKCIKHGIFEQLPKNHLYNEQGCPKCVHNYKLSNNEFIERSKKIHQNKYNYEKTKFIKFGIKVDIECKLHGIFSQRPGDHLSGNGCYKCSGFTRNKNILDIQENND